MEAGVFVSTCLIPESDGRTIRFVKVMAEYSISNTSMLPILLITLAVQWYELLPTGINGLQSKPFTG